MKNTLSEYATVWTVLADTTGAPGSTYLDSTPVDVSGYDGIMFVARLDTIPAITTGHAGLFPMVGSSSESTSMTATTGASFIAMTTTLSTAYDDMCFVVDVRKPTEQWVGCRLYKDSTNAFRGDVLGIAYNSQYMPVTQPAAEVIDSVVALTPTT